MFWILMAAAVFVLDYCLKRQVEKKPDDYRKEILGGRILLRKSHNRGAMMNLMDERQQLVAGFSLGLTVSLTAAWLYLLGRRGFGLMKTGLSLLIGGACSNVFDRLKRRYVVDYFSFQVKWKRMQKIVFNLGDICIFLGTFLLWNGQRKS